MAAVTIRTWPLVGRGVQVRVVAEALGREDIHAVVLVGDAGVGKTRLGSECLAIAEKAGFFTARVLGTQAARKIPLGALAGVVPAARLALDARASSLRQVGRSLAALGDDDPLMVLVDDAHLLDDASATVLRQLVVSGDAFVVATVRTGDLGPDAMATLWKEDLAVRIEIGPLGHDDVARLVEEVLDGPVEGPTLAELFRLSEGNPLYIRELLEGALETGLLRQADGLWRFRVPNTTPRAPRLVELVEARLIDLVEKERDALEILALGEPVPLTMFEYLTDDAAPAELERRGLIRIDVDGRRTHVRLSHPLHGEVVRHRIQPLRAMALQRRLVETLAGQQAMRSDDVLRLAVWGVESRTPVPAETLLQAAWRAHFAHDEVLAERLARAGFDAHPDAATGQLLGEILWSTGQFEQAEDVLRRAADAATTDEQVAFVAMTLASTQFWHQAKVERARATLDEALGRLGDRDLMDEIRAQRATYDLLGGHPALALAQVEPILAAGGDGRAAIEAAIAGAPALAVLGRFDEAIEVADCAFALHLSFGDLELMSHPGIHVVSRALALGESGRLTEAVDTAQAGYEAAVDEGVGEGQAWFALMLGRSLWLRRPATASRWFLEASNVFGDRHEDGPRRWCLAGAALCVASHGDGTRAGELLNEIATLSTDHFSLMASDVVRAGAWAHAARGELGTAVDDFRFAAGIAREVGAPPLEAAALHDLVRLDRADETVERLADIAAEVDAPLVAVRARHGTALAASDPDAVGEAASAFASIGADVLAAEAFAQASALRRRQGDRRGARHDARRAVATAQQAEGLRTPAMQLVGEVARLTPREREVASLAADGQSNSDIAAQLVLSVRTVANHLQRAYEKLGIGTREELTEALTHELSPSAD